MNPIVMTILVYDQYHYHPVYASTPTNKNTYLFFNFPSHNKRHLIILIIKINMLIYKTGFHIFDTFQKHTNNSTKQEYIKQEIRK